MCLSIILDYYFPLTLSILSRCLADPADKMFIVIKGKVNDYIPKTMGEINDENDKIELEIQRKKEEELAKRAEAKKNER